MNKVILMGRLTADPELRQTQSGVSSCRFTVAVNRNFVDKQTGERQADFISCTAWRQTAEFVSRYFSKGSMICVEGSLRTSSYTDRNHPDVTHYSTDVFVDNCLFDEVYTGPLMIGEKLLLSHEPINQTYALNIHGHDHSGIAKDDYHINCCANKLNYKPISLNQLLKKGALHNIESIHRQTIDRATIRKEQRNG